MTKKYNKKGFTLLEMMLVVAIILVLASATTVGLNNYIKRSNQRAQMAATKGQVYDQALADINGLVNLSPAGMPDTPPTDDNNNPGTGNAGAGGTAGTGGGSVTVAPTAAPTSVPTVAPETPKPATPTPKPTATATPVPTATVAPTATPKPTTAPAGGAGGAGSGISVGSKVGSYTVKEGDKVYGKNIVIKKEFDIGDGAGNTKGVCNVKVTGDGTYSFRIQSSQWDGVECDITVSVEGDKITFTSGNKWVLGGMRNDLWAGDSFDLTASDLQYLEKEYGLVIG